MANLKKLKQKAQQYNPGVQDITSEKSLSDNFIYSLLVNSPIRNEVEGLSTVELSSWLQQHPQLTSDFNIFNFIFDGGNYE